MEEKITLEVLLAGIRNGDPDVRTAAWQAAGKVGAVALAPLAGIAAETELEVSRAANRAMWRIVRDAGRPGAEEARKAAVAALKDLLGNDQLPVQLRRDMIWMLSEIIHDDEIEPDGAAQLLADPDLREDTRLGLQRVPGERSLAALKAGLAAAPDDFKTAIASSLRARGVEVPGLPCQKLVPTKQTSVQRVET